MVLNWSLRGLCGNAVLLRCAGDEGLALNQRSLPRSINTSASCNKKVIATEEKNCYNLVYS